MLPAHFWSRRRISNFLYPSPIRLSRSSIGTGGYRYRVSVCLFRARSRRVGTIRSPGIAELWVWLKDGGVGCWIWVRSDISIRRPDTGIGRGRNRWCGNCSSRCRALPRLMPRIPMRRRNTVMLDLAALLEDSARRYPERDALVLGEARLTYAQFDAYANRIAHLLVSRGVEPGDKVALSCPNARSSRSSTTAFSRPVASSFL